MQLELDGVGPTVDGIEVWLQSVGQGGHESVVLPVGQVLMVSWAVDVSTR